MKKVVYPIIRKEKIIYETERSKKIETGLEHYYWSEIRDNIFFKVIFELYHGKNENDEIFELLNSISESFMHARFSQDCIKDNSNKNKKINRDQFFLINYFFYNLINSLKKIFDNLAIIINLSYELKLKYQQIDLTIKNSGTKVEKFYEKLKEKDIKLFNFLIGKKTFLIDFYEFRTMLNHRYSIHIMGSDPENEIFVPKKADLFTIKNHPKVGDKASDLYIEINEKCNDLITNMIDILNFVLNKAYVKIKKK